MGSAERAEAEKSDDSRVTIAASPGARRDAPAVAAIRPPSPSQLLIDGTTARALHTEESGRTVAFSRALAALCAAGTAVLPFLYSTRPLYWPMAITIVSLGAASLWMIRRGRGARRYSRTASRVFMWACTLGGLFVIYDIGVFSPAPLFVTLGISYFGQSQDRRFALMLPTVSAVGYFVLTILVMLGVVPDLGLFSALNAPRGIRITMLLIVPIAFLVALWQARLGRRATLAAIAEANDALRLVLKREAQLDEARADLDRALRAGAGATGRFTGAMMGRYRLAEIIGRGAMGEIYAATDVESGASAAVKLLQANVAHDPDLVERFFREGRIATRLDAPNVVTVYDVGGAEGVPYIAMELLVGQDLSAHLRQRQQLLLEEVLELVDDVAHGLAAAHKAGVVHRDLKPQNIFRAEAAGRRPTWKILDFGVSKLLDTSATLTRAAVIGTPGYMSPEQAQGHDADHRSDVFALGAVTYRALAGRPPFSGEMPLILLEIAYKSPSRPSDYVSDLPSDVDLVLALALAKRREDRFDSALELSAALADASRGELDPALRARATALLSTLPWRPSLASLPDDASIA